MFATAPPGDPRLFIVERGGTIRILQDGQVLGVPFLDISDRVDGRGEGGLLGLAFAPDYASSRAFYLYYTADGSPLTSRISRFRANVSNPNVADDDPGQEKILLSVNQPADNNNGGTVAFGADGMLYMAFGDGGGSNDPDENAQRRSTLLGKMIRIDVSFSNAMDDYTIPGDNPFVGNADHEPEIWALGLRNPFRFSFDRETGDLYIGDVGQGSLEEIDVEPAGAPGARNYGWDVMEGTDCFEAPDAGEPPCNDASLTLPVYEYDHSEGLAVTGGNVYRGSVPGLQGQYVFSDYASARIWTLVWDGAGGVVGSVVDRTAEFTPDQGTIGSVVAFGEDGAGELYIVDIGGEVFRIGPISCGDGHLDGGEECDDGNKVSGDGCDDGAGANCTPTACGNGVVTSGEECDDGNTDPADGCSSTCRLEVCGNFIVDPNEVCDDGNIISGDGCDANCKPTACGNRIVTAGEECDDGNTGPGDGCSATCLLEICGNDIPDPGESCDDGNLTSGDGCDANCTVTACRNGIVTTGEQCDDGNDVAGDGCDPNCTATGCGNAVITPPEQCDDGDAVSGDGCDINCTLTACGNGIATLGEACDDGDLVSGDGCDSNCTPTSCGNNVVTLGEECDDGNSISGDGCDADCQFSRCGNGTADDSEECDDGNNVSGDGCDADCTFTSCGNGIVTDGEQCDDGNVIEDDGCDSTCQENYGIQTHSQTKCIVNVNKGIAKVARTQAKANERCLESSPSAFDDCLEADSKGKVSRAKQDLQKLERNKCLVSEPPELALGADHLSGSPAASALPVQLVRDLLGDPATAAPKGDDKAARCQTHVLKQANKLFDVIWDEIRAAKADALEGRGTDAVVNDEQLSAYIEQMLTISRSVTKANDKLYNHVRDACEEVDTLLTIPACEVGSASAVADCVDRAARCRACQLLIEADPRLTMDCDGFDNGLVDLSCQP